MAAVVGRRGLVSLPSWSNRLIFFRNLATTSIKRSEAPATAEFYTDEHKELQRSLKKLIDSEINPHVDQWEAEGQFPAHEVFGKLGKAGFLGVCKPEEYGGLGLDYSYSMAMSEALGTINCGAIPMAVAVQTDMSTPALARFGSNYLKEEFLAPSISGEKVSCLGVSEPGAGSDVASIQTTAKRDGDDLIINGQKMWITNAWQADWICLLANTSQGPAHLNKSLICVPMNSPGIHLTKRIDKMGMRSSDTAQIFFEDVRVPAKNIIGDEGMGFTYQMLQFQEERLAGAVLTIPPMDTCIQSTIAYTKERKAFGQPLLNNQCIHFRLAELETEIECLRSLIYRATDLYVAGEDVTKLASMAKLKAGRLAREVTDSCLQFWGGMGFTNEVLVSRFFRDMRLVSIGGGADEVMLMIICKYMDTLPRLPRKK
ncbi:probable acyl-CoA dehydrogenase 6 isoform X2 [Homarus americanus]|uniref:probable acyl-CoA dehydrogenase 6 isoform X2 n=1 Tax=Homarus americanus TaxID=6706 RepID=UPI001C46AC33|nr:probable acyl-CoA dehydrogenase 6 isoform X2 [Homarus americanus]